jgi:hypothetical protein
MIQEHGKVEGNLTIDREYVLYGMCTGNIRVAADGHLTLFGMCTGNVLVEPGGQLRLHGMVTGNVVNDGGKVLESRLDELARGRLQ